MKDYNIMIDERSFFHQPVKMIMITLKKLQLVKVIITRNLLDYSYFKKYYELIAIDVSKKTRC